MKYTVRLRDIVNHYSATIPCTWESDGDEGTILYMWNDGNYSCDCNRGRFLYPHIDTEWDCNINTPNIIVLDAITFEGS